MPPDPLGRTFDDLPRPEPDPSHGLAAFLVGVGGALAAGSLLGALLRRRGARRGREAAIDAAMEDSHPASDPPSFAGGATAGRPGPRSET
jgi:hypothetical protein